MTKSIKSRINMGAAFLIFVPVILISWYSLTNLNDFTLELSREHLEEEVHVIRNALKSQSFSKENSDSINNSCNQLASGTATRISAFLLDGTVVGDSEKDPSLLENHFNREEFQAALAGETGYSIRMSTSIDKNLLYVALPVFDEQSQMVGIIRGSYPINKINERFFLLLRNILLISFFIIIIVFAISSFFIQKIVDQIRRVSEAVEQYARGHFESRIRLTKTKETIVLKESLDTMAEQLEDRIKTITAQNNQLNAILSSMSEAVIVLDPGMNIIGTNPSTLKMFPDELSNAVSKNILDVFKDSQLLDFLRNLKSSRKEISEQTFTLRHQNQKIYLQFNATSLRNRNKSVEGFLLVINNITKLKRLEKVRRDFVANVSHELKTPVTSIQGFVETLISGAAEDPEARDKFLTIIDRQTKRIVAIIEDLLILSSLEDSGGTKVQKEVVDIKMLLVSSINTCEYKASQKDIKVNLDCSKNIFTYVNPVLIEQAFVNLLDNAIKYSPEQTSIEVSVVRKKGKILIHIKDQGIGIPLKDQPRIFERFYRVDKARSRTMGGTGLGLAIVKHIVLINKGKIKLSDTSERGTTFTISLPSTKLSVKHEGTTKIT